MDRWVERLLTLRYRIHHIDDEENRLADLGSRWGNRFAAARAVGQIPAGFSPKMFLAGIIRPAAKNAAHSGCGCGWETIPPRRSVRRSRERQEGSYGPHIPRPSGKSGHPTGVSGRGKCFHVTCYSSMCSGSATPKLSMRENGRPGSSTLVASKAGGGLTSRGPNGFPTKTKSCTVYCTPPSIKGSPDTVVAKRHLDSWKRGWFGLQCLRTLLAGAEIVCNASS